MVAKKSTARKSTAKTKTTKAKGPAKPQAVADDLDLDHTAGDEDLQAQPRRSKWIVLLDKLYEATIAGKVPRGDDGSLRFVKLGAFTNINGARTQARSMEAKGLGETYEFKTVTRSGEGSELWGRVIEVEADA